MQVEKTTLEGVLRIIPQVFGDARGYFMESYSAEKYRPYIGDVRWVQDNESRSGYGVLRGFAYQAKPFTQAKLVRVTEGCVLDVVLDIRKGSATFGQHVATELTADNKVQVFIPRGFAHAFLVLSETAVLQYKVDNTFSLEHECGVRFDDPALEIQWPVALEKIVVSAKDGGRPLLAEAEVFNYGETL